MKKILCIDGGGIKGVFPASFLATLEGQIEGNLGDYFDLIVGTSTGGIIALGLAAGLSAQEIRHLYIERGDEIFGHGRRSIADTVGLFARNLKWAVKTKHKPDALQCALTEVFGHKKIGHAKTRLVVPAWSATAGAPYIYKTAHHPRLTLDYKIPMVEAAMATAAAPTFFPAHLTQHSDELLDGGVWANNPIAIAIVEAIALLGWDRHEFVVLSVGCLQEVYDLPVGAGILRWIKPLIALLMDGQSKGAHGMAKLLTGDEHERAAIYRIDRIVEEGRFKMDDPSQIGRLNALGHNVGRDRYPHLKSIFFEEKAEAFVPFHRLEGDQV